MQRDISYFSDILVSSKLAVEYLEKISFDEFIQNTAIQDAVIRRIEIIGEAANRIGEQSKKKYDHLPWIEMKGMRNLLIHEYDEIDLKEVWNTVKNDLPALIIEMEKIVD
jgi:uncharacterized protein with HEPN domain